MNVAESGDQMAYLGSFTEVTDCVVPAGCNRCLFDVELWGA